MSTMLRSAATPTSQHGTIRSLKCRTSIVTSKLRCMPAQRMPAFTVRAAGQGEPSAKDKEKTDKILKGMKQGGVDKATAQKILRVWEETGVTSSDALRKMLVKRSLSTAGVVGLQTLLDAGASWGGFNTANYLRASPDFFAKIVLEWGAYFLGLYFAASVVFDCFTLGAVVVSSLRFSTDSDAFLTAIREIAGSQGQGLNVVSKAQQAVNTAKIVGALNKISDILREQGGEAAAGDTLKNLSAFLTLSRAEEKGFQASKYGLSEEEAGRLAVVFARYDVNDDMSLESSEISRLMQQEGYNFDEAETKQAIQLLDTNNDGLISFEEFVDWATNKVSDEAKARVEPKVPVSK